jgi:drug/metabolite transporter (DMT)-like permease
VALTALALCAFAGNSVLCRLALREGAIDPWSFTALRLVSGALLLAPLLLRRRGDLPAWRPAGGLALAAYAAAFSLAYVSLPAGTGALLLFGTVQLTMFAAALRRGERLSPLGAAGVVAAAAGVVVLVLPGVRAPDPVGAALMIAAGVAWGAYSLLGRGNRAPVLATAQNFVFAAPLVAAAAALGPEATWSLRGAALAIASGTLTSGLGYVVWYAALPGLSATRAAVVQLAVPALAAAGGAVTLGERLDERLLLAGALTIGGIAAALGAPARRAR